MSLSLVGQAILYARLPDTAWRSLVSSLGYPLGFVIVVIGRQQLFTENTITAVLPVFAHFSSGKLWLTARLWAIVLLANLAGTLITAAFYAHSQVLAPELLNAMTALAQHEVANPWAAMLLKGIPAGFIVAAMVWLIPGAESASFVVIAFLSYTIAAGGFTHVVAGSTGAFFLMLTGEAGLFAVFWHFLVPVLVGNIIGGTALFALLSYGQVMNEM